MRRLWAICLLLASAKALPTNQLNQSCRLTTDCSSAINLRHIQRLERYMRPELSPCEDFHAYACGNWRSVHAAGVSAMSLSGTRVDQRYVDLFERLLREPHAPEHRLPMHAKLLRYYQSCRALGKPRLRRYLEQLPHPASNHWTELMALLGRYGYHEHYVKIEVSQHNATRHMVVVQPHNYNHSLNLTTAIYGALRRHTHAQLPHLGQLRSQFGELDAKLQQLSRPTNGSSDEETLHFYTLGQLQRELPDLNWTHVLQLQLGATYTSGHQLLVDEPPVLKQLITYLNQADARLLQLYSWARFLQHLQKLPHNPLRHNHFTASASSSIGCVQHMRKTLYLPMNYAYEHNYYGKQREADERVIFGVFEELKSQFAQQLRRNEFGLDATLLPALLNKVYGLRLNVGNMPRNASEQFFVDCAQHWRVGSDFYENHLESLLHYYAHLAELERSMDASMRQLWYSFNHHGPELLDNIDATPYFYCLGSIIIMPYAYVQLPFYNAEFWPALLYGDLANTLGHEMLHAFDTYFVDYDAQGAMRDYSEQLLLNTHYVSAVNCLNDSEVIMLNERAADISGTRLALQTYMQQPAEKRNNGRLYFIQFAQFFCGEEADIYHDTGSKRLNYALAQMPEFAEVFQCDPGMPMNPVERCKFW
ncbi:membrane metallo-endopeptidase-like 1 [Drosophila grimshawi]|uniref:GH10990 n=1 Tax=Drosophila grimshawi TaxID=7222 RepID=B4JBP5_DROGR|nr:membrane metallo-endopeptidase-like 1 [Drosophila grimshawi]EDW02980.1 GH10990 [Drosophila grimshawi]